MKITNHSNAVEKHTFEDIVHRDEFINKHAGLVKIIALQVSHSLPKGIELDDLISAGTVGLIDSYDKFDPSKEVQFKTYASIRIRGAILDELRQMDWMSRSMREKSNMIDRAIKELEKTCVNKPRSEDIAQYLGMSNDRYYEIEREVKATSLMNVEDLKPEGLDIKDVFDCLKNPNAIDPYIALENKEVKKILMALLYDLNKKENLVLSLYYFDSMTMKDIGSKLNITESRVCQLHSQAVNKLKSKLKRRLDS